MITVIIMRETLYNQHVIMLFLNSSNAIIIVVNG